MDQAHDMPAPDQNASAARPRDSAAVELFRNNQSARRGPVRHVLIGIRHALIAAKSLYLRKMLGMDIHPSCRFSLKVNFDKTNPRGVHVDAGTYIAFNAVILAHDMSRLVHMHTRIGKNCFIGAHAIIMPGVTIGDQCIVGAGAVVTQDVPSHSICAGNPAKVIKSGIVTREYGILKDVYEVALASS
jgi:acetyltransferase-like isoleucine patch superfamily enzyme